MLTLGFCECIANDRATLPTSVRRLRRIAGGLAVVGLVLGVTASRRVVLADRNVLRRNGRHLRAGGTSERTDDSPATRHAFCCDHRHFHSKQVNQLDRKVIDPARREAPENCSLPKSRQQICLLSNPKQELIMHYQQQNILVITSTYPRHATTMPFHGCEKSIGS